MKQIRNTRFLNASVLIGVGVAFLLLNLLTWLYADDYAYAFCFRRTGGIDLTAPVRSLADVAVSQYNHYFVKNGRTVVHALNQLFLSFGSKHIFDCCNALVFMLFVYMTQVVAGKRGWRETLMITALLFVCTRSFGLVFLWQTGSFNYLWAGTANLIFLTLLRRYADSDSMKVGALLFLPSLLIGWMHESFSIGIAALLLAVLIKRGLRQEGSITVVAWMTVGYVVGTLLILLAPGTLHRAASSGIGLHYALAHLGAGFLNVLLNLRIFWLLVGMVVVQVIRQKIMFRAFVCDNGYLLLGMAAQACFLMFLGHVVEPRALFGVELLALVLLLRLIPSLPNWITVIVAAVLVFTFGWMLRLTWKNALLTRAFFDEVNTSADGIVFFDVPEYHGKERHYLGSRVDLDFHRTAFNQEFSTYYGKPAIMVLPACYRQTLYLTSTFISPEHECSPGKFTSEEDAFLVSPLPAEMVLPASTPMREYVSFPSGYYLIEDKFPLVGNGNLQQRPRVKHRRRAK